MGQSARLSSDTHRYCLPYNALVWGFLYGNGVLLNTKGTILKNYVGPADLCACDDMVLGMKEMGFCGRRRCGESSDWVPFFDRKKVKDLMKMLSRLEQWSA